MGIKITPELYNQLPSNPVEKLLICFDSQDEIAAFCFVTPQAVWNWKERETIPKAHVEALSRYTGIPEWILCPKWFAKKGEMDAVDGVVRQWVRQDGSGQAEDA